MKKVLLILSIISILMFSCKNNGHKAERTLPFEKFCLIDTISAKTLSVDFIELCDTSGQNEKANRKIILELPDGSCFVNAKKESEAFALTPNTKIVMQTFSYDKEGNFNFNEKVELKKFLEKFQNPNPFPWKHSPYQVTIINKKITSLREIYIP